MFTALTLFDNILNSRKITPMIEDPNDPECFTPNRLPDVFSEDDLSIKQRWRIAQAVWYQFCSHYMKEVLSSLTERGKWYREGPNLEVEDIVVIMANWKDSLNFPWWWRNQPLRDHLDQWNWTSFTSSGIVSPLICVACLKSRDFRT